jgi:hypothetical protein
MPSTLVITRVFCSELSIRVPSWTAADKFLQEPLSLQLGDLFIDVRHLDECDDDQRQEAERRVQAARFEADPLGSIASMYAFATMISERLALSVSNVYVKVFVQRAKLQLHLELADLRVRTTNALWQDMRDLSNCVDRSPDGLLRTRFKFVSFVCSLQVLAAGETTTPLATSTPITLLHEHPVSIRMTLFGQRSSSAESWEALSRVVDVSLGVLRFEHSAQQYAQLCTIFHAIYRWSLLSSAAEASSQARLHHHHQVHRGSVGHGAGRFDSNNSSKRSTDPESVDSAGNASQASFAWQITLRGSLEAVMTFQSEHLGKQSVSFVAQQAIVNLIVGQDESCELQLSLDALVVRFRDAIVAKLTPERGVLRVKKLPLSQNGVLVQWRLQHIECRIEGDLALVLNELYHSLNEKELAETITCGTCHHKIRLDDIDSHICGKMLAKPRATSSVLPSGSTAGSPRADPSPLSSPAHLSDNVPESIVSSDTDRRHQSALRAVLVRVVLHLEELEFYADSHLFHNIQQLMKTCGGAYTVDRTIAVKLSRVKLTTESTEFDGSAVFVPVLPLAFQMLECTVQDCGCWQLRHGGSVKLKNNGSSKRLFPRPIPEHQPSPLAEACCWEIPLLGLQVQYPDRCFLDVDHASITAFDPQAAVVTSKSASGASFVVEGFKLRSSFSDGSSVCASCHPQGSVHVQVDRVRCQVDPSSFRFLQREIKRISSEFISSTTSSDDTAPTLFTAVLQLRALEFTLWEQAGSQSVTPQNKSLFKQVAAVIDNQLGYLSTQSTLDFRTLLASPTLMRFTHNQVPMVLSTALNNKAPAQCLQLTRLSACRRIQHFVRQYCVSSHLHYHQHQIGSSQSDRADDVGVPCAPSNGDEVRPGEILNYSHTPDSNAAEVVRAASTGTLDHKETSKRPAPRPAVRESGPAHHAKMPSPLDSKHTANKQDRTHQPRAVPGSSHDQQPGISKPLGSMGTSLLSTAEDLVNPMKMVAGAASVFRGGFKMVKSTHQAIETEVVGLATQSLESAARLVNLPRIGIPIKSPFLSPFSSPTSATEVRAPIVPTVPNSDHGRGHSSEIPDGHDGHEEGASDADQFVEVIEQEDPDRDAGADHEGGDGDDNGSNGDHTYAKATTTYLESGGVDMPIENTTDKGLTDPEADDCDELGGLSVERELEMQDVGHGSPSDNEVPLHNEEDEPTENKTVPVGISDTLLSSLPPVVRLLVQVDEHRLCIPINPREKVGYLCREVVRRYNELFAISNEDDNGETSHYCSSSALALTRVALHDRFGGVFCPSDLVGHLIFDSTPIGNDTHPFLFFARQIDPDTQSIRPRACVALTAGENSEYPALVGAAGHREEDHERRLPVGDKFTRCSIVPLPLAVALLANESEGELLRSILTQKSCFAGRGDGDSASVDADGCWPELALNADRLERLLPVEVAWFSHCIEVTHVDAFVLCLQQLGMCSSQPMSRFIGRALRDRLRIEASNANPLVTAAWRRRQAAQLDRQESSLTRRTTSRGQEQARHNSISRSKDEITPPTYEAVKQSVQDRAGTYIRDGRA